MTIDVEMTPSAEQYAAAHVAHYVAKDLRSALELYQGIIATYPDTRETEYSRTQIHNIVSTVVPKRELIDAQVSLALTHLESGHGPNARAAAVTPGSVGQRG